MIFEPLSLAGVFLVKPERFSDERGFFARTYCAEEFTQAGIDPTIAQCNVSFNPETGTLRGMHLQADPFGETKSVRCTRGEIFDVLVDLRQDSPTQCQWVGRNLSADNQHTLIVPPGVAHGFLTLAAESEVFYQISTPYQPDAGRGVRWDDPRFAINWPAEPQLMSERDRTYADFDPSVGVEPATS